MSNQHETKKSLHPFSSMRRGKKNITLALLAIGIIIGIFVYLSYQCHKDFERSSIAQTQDQLLTIGKTTAASIEEFAEALAQEAKILADEPAVKKEIRERVQQTKLHVCPIKIFYMAHKDKVDALTTLDADGIKLHRHPFWEDNTDRLGTKSDKPGVQYVLREHKPYISEVFQSSLGQPAISISAPVFDKEEFIGMVRWMITIEKIAKRFIKPVRVGKKGYVWLLDEKGTLLVHQEEGQLNTDFLTLRKKQRPDHEWSELEDIVRKSIAGQEGVGIYTCPLCGRRIVAFVPVHLGDRTWSIGVTMDYSEIAGPILDHALHHIEITVLIMFLLIAGGCLFYVMERKRTSELIHKNIEFEQEVTERRRVETALRESEGKLAGIVGSVTDLMIMVDSRFNIVWANDVAEKLFGPDMVGKKCHSVYHGRDAKCPQCIVRKCFDDGGIHEFETQIASSDGKLMTFWCTANVAARNEDGSPKMVVEFLRNITESRRSATELAELKGQIEFILGATNTGIDIIDSEFNVKYIDPEWGKIYGDPTGRKCYEYFMGRSEMCPGCGIPNALETQEITVTEEVLVREGNRPIQVTTRPFQNERGEWLVAEVNVDITERKQAEEKIRKSLQEKEVLLKEIHHRVKNNMQVISSLLKLQAKYIKDQDAVEMFKDSHNRIRSMALVHEKLYQSEGLANINFKEYINNLLDMLARSYGTAPGQITLSVDVEEAAIAIDTAIPCGLIVNELVSNALKHAFPQNKSGAITVSLRSTGQNRMELMVGDNGVGMPEGLDYQNVDSLGLKLVNILTKQLGGTLVLDGGEGTVFRINFFKQYEPVH